MYVNLSIQKEKKIMTENTVQAEEIRSAVRQQYGQFAREFGQAAGSGCCAPSSSSDCGCGDTASASLASALYEADVSELPDDVTGMSLGCGDPITLAQLQPGQTVVDLGSGGGIDCFLAARQVGPGGRVIGVDMTSDMISKARANARKINAENVEFRLGEIEHLPVADETVDVIISNCVINLSPDKPQVFRDALRVLRPGGQLAVSDIVTRVELPLEVQQNLASWAGCVAGAWVDKDYVAAIEAAGFVDVSIGEKVIDPAAFGDNAISAEQLGLELDPNSTERPIYSARITARKPLQHE
jgi:arsenite methyltransferase